MGRIKTAMATAMAGVLVAGSALAKNTGFGGGSTNGGGAGGGTGGGSTTGGGVTESWGVENSGSALDEICNLALWVYEGSLPIVYVVAVIGLVMMAIKTMVSGKFEMSNLFWWGTVLVFVSGTPAVLLLLTQGDVSSVACAV